MSENKTSKTKRVAFRLGEKVWAIAHTHVKCLACKGKGRLSGPGFGGGIDNRCPACYGNGYRVWAGEMIVREGRVTSIKLSENYGVKYNVRWLEKRPVVTGHMSDGDTWGEPDCVVGNGGNIFATRQEAVAELRRRNT